MNTYHDGANMYDMLRKMEMLAEEQDAVQYVTMLNLVAQLMLENARNKSTAARFDKTFKIGKLEINLRFN